MNVRSFICNELEPIAYLIYLISVLLYYARHKHMRHAMLAAYYGISAALLYIGIVVTSISNNWSYNALFFLCICVLSWFYQSLLTDRLKKVFVQMCAGVNIALFVYYNILRQSFFVSFNSTVYGIAFISVVVYSLFYLHQTLTNVKEENILMNFDFWLISGYLLYFLGSFVIVIYYENADTYLRGNMWAMQNIILFLCSNILLVACLSILKKEKLVHG